jgi:hypothetical protein
MSLRALPKNIGRAWQSKSKKINDSDCRVAPVAAGAPRKVIEKAHALALQLN